VLGRQLVERRRNAVSLTGTGAEVAERARRILLEANDLVDHARCGPGLLGGRLDLGVIPSIAPYLLPAALPLLQSRHPELDLRLRETQTATLLDEVLGGQLDVALLSLPVEKAGLETMRLFDDPFVLVVPAFGRLADTAPGGSLAGETLLLLEEGHCLREQALSLCRLPQGGGRRQYGASSLSTIMQMVANGFGTTLLPAMALPVELRREMPVKLYRFRDPAPRRSIGLVWRRTSPRRADVEALGGILGEIADRSGWPCGIAAEPERIGLS
jgi:LysR family hydrogen peroxide-inducible transcriptional activator